MSVFLDKLQHAWAMSNSQLVVGLDPDPAAFPPALPDGPDRILRFCQEIVRATAPHACGFKPQIAYFAAQAAEAQLADLCLWIRETYPDHMLILDAKRGDVGSTATQYAREAFERFSADAVTVNPYMGSDAVAPFLAWRDKGVIVLCRTSNPGGDDLQNLHVVPDTPLYLHVAGMVADQWNLHQQCALVVGATYPEEIRQVRERVGDMPLLIPGVGAQGGDLQATVRAGRNRDGTGMLINSGRAILYASQGVDWREAATAAARDTRDAINATLQPFDSN